MNNNTPELPPKRPLPDREAMLQRILHSEPDQDRPAATPSPARGSRLLAVAAVVVLLVGIGTGLVWLTGRMSTAPVPPARQSSAPTAAPSSGPSSAPTAPTPSPTAASPTAAPIGTTATFDNFEVTVLEARWRGDWYGVKARTCVRQLPPDPQGDRTQVTRQPWQLVLADGDALVPSPKSPFGDSYPKKTLLRVGECAEGWIPFTASRAAELSTVDYANFVGEQASWQVG